jgi:hypothetical protein
LFSDETRKAISDGDFTIVRAQYCVYLPTSDVSVFLQILSIMFAQTIASGKGVTDLATYLGLQFQFWPDRRNHLVKGAMFTKRHGSKTVYSALFYNKRKRVSQMQQGKTLMEVETDTIDNNVRFDMTAHPAGIMEIVTAARKHLTALRKLEPGLFENTLGKAFLDAEPGLPRGGGSGRSTCFRMSARATGSIVGLSRSGSSLR